MRRPPHVAETASDRALHLSFVFPRFKTLSGAETLLLGLCGRLAERGHSVTILTRALSPRCSSAVPPGVRILPHSVGRASPRSHLIASALDVLLSPLSVCRLDPRTDLVTFVSDPVLPGMWFHRRVLRRDTPTRYYCLQPPRFVYDLQAQTTEAFRPFGALIPWVAPVYRWVDRGAACACACDRILAASTHYREWCRSLYRHNDIELLFPGFEAVEPDVAAEAQLRRRYRLPERGPLVLTVNKLIRRKNVDLMLRAWKLLRPKHPTATAMVVGDGPELPKLRSLAAALKIDRSVVFTGFLETAQEVAACYAACDLYMFLERNVPFGLTVVEAASHGKPVIAVHGGGTADTVIDGMTGSLLDPSLRLPDIAAAMDRWLSRRDGGSSVAHRARSHAQQFTLDRHVTAFLDIANEMVAKTPQARDRSAEEAR